MTYAEMHFFLRVVLCYVNNIHSVALLLVHSNSCGH